MVVVEINISSQQYDACFNLYNHNLWEFLGLFYIYK